MSPNQQGMVQQTQQQQQHWKPIKVTLLAVTSLQVLLLVIG